MNQTDREENEYILGTNDDELLRLGFQHQVWAPITTALWQRAGFGPGQQLLDLGSGPGFASFDLAALTGSTGEVLAVDVSRRFIDYLITTASARGAANVRAEVQDVERLALSAECVDGAFARWVLCFTASPGEVIGRVARALRPGGCFAVLDYCNYSGIAMAPPSDAIARVATATAESVRLRGGNMNVGLEIPKMMREAGLVVEYLAPVVRLARPGSALWRWPETFFAGYLATLLEMQMVTGSEADEFRRSWSERSRDPAAFLMTPPMVAVVGRKAPAG